MLLIYGHPHRAQRTLGNGDYAITAITDYALEKCWQFALIANDQHNYFKLHTNLVCVILICGRSWPGLSKWRPIKHARRQQLPH